MRPYPKHQREYYAPRPDDPTWARARAQGRRFVDERHLISGARAKVAWEPIGAYVTRKLTERGEATNVWTGMDDAYWRGAMDRVIELDLDLEVAS